MGNTHPNHKGNYYYRNHTLYNIGTLDPLGPLCSREDISRGYRGVTTTVGPGLTS